MYAPPSLVLSYNVQCLLVCCFLLCTVQRKYSFSQRKCKKKIYINKHASTFQVFRHDMLEKVVQYAYVCQFTFPVSAIKIKWRTHATGISPLGRKQHNGDMCCRMLLWVWGMQNYLPLSFLYLHLTCLHWVHTSYQVLPASKQPLVPLQPRPNAPCLAEAKMHPEV